jgi:hypothetical protein
VGVRVIRPRIFRKGKALALAIQTGIGFRCAVGCVRSGRLEEILRPFAAVRARAGHCYFVSPSPVLIFSLDNSFLLW